MELHEPLICLKYGLIIVNTTKICCIQMLITSPAEGFKLQLHMAETFLFFSLILFSLGTGFEGKLLLKQIYLA